MNIEKFYLINEEQIVDYVIVKDNNTFTIKYSESDQWIESIRGKEILSITENEDLTYKIDFKFEIDYKNLGADYLNELKILINFITKDENYKILKEV